MRFLCLLEALLVAAIASPVTESLDLNKRILGGNGGLLGGLLGGILGNNGLVGGIGQLLDDVLGGVLPPVVNLLENLKKALGGKQSKDLCDMLEQFPESKLCMACDVPTIPEQRNNCRQYCEGLIRKAKQ